MYSQESIDQGGETIKEVDSTIYWAGRVRTRTGPDVEPQPRPDPEHMSEAKEQAILETDEEMTEQISNTMDIEETRALPLQCWLLVSRRICWRRFWLGQLPHE